MITPPAGFLIGIIIFIALMTIVVTRFSKKWENESYSKTEVKMATFPVIPSTSTVLRVNFTLSLDPSTHYAWSGWLIIVIPSDRRESRNLGAEAPHYSIVSFWNVGLDFLIRNNFFSLRQFLSCFSLVIAVSGSSYTLNEFPNMILVSEPVCNVMFVFPDA